MFACDLVKRRSRILGIQKEKLVRLVQNFFISNIGRYFGVNGVQIDNKTWQRFSNDLNLIGPLKSSDQYKQSFNYMKSRVRSKMGLILESGGNAEDNLSELDQKIFKMFPLVSELKHRHEGLDEDINVEQLQNESNLQEFDLHRISDGLISQNELVEVIDDEPLQDYSNLQEFEPQRISNGLMNENESNEVIDNEQLHESNLQEFDSQHISDGWMNVNESVEVIDDEQLQDESNLQEFDSQRISNGRMNENELNEVIDDEQLHDETNLQEFALPRILVVHSAEELEAYMNETHMISTTLPEDSPHQIESSNPEFYGQTINRRFGNSTRGGSTTSISRNIANTRGGRTPSMRGKSVNTRGGSTTSMRGKSANSKKGLTTSTSSKGRRTDHFNKIPDVIPDIQRERLVQLVHNNFLKTVGRYSGANGKERKRQLWDKYTRELNTLGPPRTALQWENCLDYIRGTAKMKLAENRRNENEFGRGKKVLSRLEGKVVCAWGLNNLDGEQQLGEGGFQYEKTIVDRTKSWTASKTSGEGGDLGLNRSERTQISNSTITSGAYMASLSRPRPMNNGNSDPRAGRIVSKCNLCWSPNLHSHCERCNQFFCGMRDTLHHNHPNRIDHLRTTIVDRTQNSKETAKTTTSSENIIDNSHELDFDLSEGTQITTSKIISGGSMDKSRRLNVSNQQAMITSSFSYGISLDRVETEDIQTFESNAENDANVTGDYPELIGESNCITYHSINEFESVEIESERQPCSAPAHMRSSTANVTQFLNSREEVRSTNASSTSRAPCFREQEAALPYRNARRNVRLVQDQSLARSGRDLPRERNYSKASTASNPVISQNSTVPSNPSVQNQLISSQNHTLVSSTNSTSNMGPAQILLSTALVKVRSKEGNWVILRAFLDVGSQRNVVTED